MENAVDALKLGAFVMIFVIALSVSITAFSGARIAASTLLDYKDRETSLGESDYWYSNDSNKQRIVGMETIIPTVYRAYSDESLKIVFLDDKGTAKGLYQIQNNDETFKDINTLGYIYDSKLFGLTPETKLDFINKILYNKDSSYTDDYLYKGGIIFNKGSLYEYIKDKKFLEFSGIYISGEEEGISDKPEANKQSIRVITYQEI